MNLETRLAALKRDLFEELHPEAAKKWRVQNSAGTGAIGKKRSD